MDDDLNIPRKSRDRALLLTAATFFGGTEALRDFLLHLKPDLKNPQDFKNCLAVKKQELNLNFEDQKLLVFPPIGFPDINKFDISLLAKVIFACTDFALEELRDKLIEHEPRLADTKYFEQCVQKANSLAPAEKLLMCPVTEEPDIKKLDITLLRRFKNTCIKFPKEPKKAFDINNLDLANNPPKGDYGYVRLIEHLRDEFAHWGDKELSEEAYKKYWAALEAALLKLNFDVKEKLRIFKSGIRSSEAEILKGMMLASYGKMQDRIHMLEGEIKKEIYEVQEEQAFNFDELRRENDCLHKQVADLGVGLVQYATEIAELNECTRKSADKIQREMKKTMECIEEVSDTLIDLKNQVAALGDRVDHLEAAPEACLRLSTKEFLRRKKKMKKLGFEFVEKQRLTDPFSKRQRNVELELRVNQVILPRNYPYKDVAGVEREILHDLTCQYGHFRTYEQIFSTQTQVTFVRAVGGGGKSVLSTTLYHLWCRGKIWEKFDFVVMLQARVLNALNSSSASHNTVDDILQTDPVFRRCGLSFKKLRLSEKRVLIILDGLDEFIFLDELVSIVRPSKRPEPTPLGHGLKDLVDSVIDSKRWFVLFLGRHVACMRLEEAWQSRNIGTRVFELSGLCLREIEEYIAKFADGNPNMQVRLRSFLEASACVMSLASIPLYLWVFCSAFSASESTNGLRTQTELLVHMLLGFIKGHVRVSDCDDLSQYEVFELLERTDLCQLLECLSKVAYDNLSENRLMFLIKNSELSPYSADGYGLLIATKAPDGWRYQFKHKSLQELLTAAYIATEADIQAEDVISNKFLRPCLPMLCAFKGAMLERSQSPSLIQDFVKKMLRPRKENATHDELIRSLYERVAAEHSELTYWNYRWIEFLSCYKEYSNFVNIESCIRSLFCDDRSSSYYSELVRNFLQRFSQTGIVRKLHIRPGPLEIKGWLNLCSALSMTPPDKRLMQLRVDNPPHLSKDEIFKSTFKLALQFETCNLYDMDLMCVPAIAQAFGDCSLQSTGVSSLISASGNSNISKKALENLVHAKFERPPGMLNPRLITYFATGVHLQVLLADTLHLRELSKPHDRISIEMPPPCCPGGKFHEAVSSLHDQSVIIKISRAETKIVDCETREQVSGGLGFGPEDFSIKHCLVTCAFPTTVFLAMLRALGRSIRTAEATRLRDTTRLLLTKDNLSVIAWILLLSRMFGETAEELERRLRKYGVFNQLENFDEYVRSRKWRIKGKDAKMFDGLFPESVLLKRTEHEAQKFRSILHSSKKIGVTSMKYFDFMDKIIEMGPTENFFNDFDMYWNEADGICNAVYSIPYFTISHVESPSIVFGHLPRYAESS